MPAVSMSYRPGPVLAYESRVSHRLCDIALWLRRLGAVASLWQRQGRHDARRTILQTSGTELLGPGSSNKRNERYRLNLMQA